jgi:starvation-inducible DNA-binding protein
MKKSASSAKNGTNVLDGLSCLLADTYLLYLKTQNFHWNVSGPNFYSLHKMFEGQYEQLAEAADLLAERIRAIGEKAPGSFSEFLKMTSLEEAGDDLSAAGMIETLLKDHESLADAANRMIEAAQEEGDEVTADIMIARKTEHDKTAWMLRSSLEK